tara:strand:+ start:2477 stop:2653 length:177 start_codon:yes stop_codon:yes gene_type:complete
VRRIELPSSAWKAEVLAVELHPQAYDAIGFLRLLIERRFRNHPALGWEHRTSGYTFGL